MLKSIPNILATVQPSGKGIWMPEQASAFAPTIDFVFDFITWLSIFFFVLIVGVMCWFIWKYHRRAGHRAEITATHHTALELTWTIIPLILVIAIFYVGMQGYIRLTTPPANAYEIRVTAQKWFWQFDHNNGASEVGTLTLPKDRPVRLVMQAKDVIHSLFIPAFRVKQDVVPGRITDLWFEATHTGVFDLFCTEYCGTSHSDMVAIVHVLDEEAFLGRIDELAREFETKSDEELPAYAIDRLYNRCASCHSLDGKDGTGPSFKGLWDRTVAGETVFTNGSRLSDLVGSGKEFPTPEDYIRDSLLNPGHFVRANFTNAMPSFKGQLKDRQIDAFILLFKNWDRYVDPQGKRIAPGS